MTDETGKLVHASAVAIARQAVLVVGPSGAGKSRLALALITQGAVLLADDYVRAWPQEGRIWLAPPERLQGLIELRGIGICRLPYLRAAPLRLVVAITTEEAQARPRLPETARWALGDLTAPQITLLHTDPAAAARVRTAFEATAGVLP